MSRQITWRGIAVLLFTVMAISIYAQKNPSEELGFKPQKLYDFHDVDSVNLFNGNLMLTLKIGQEYRVGPTLTYQLTAVYNGKVWDYESWDCADFSGQPICDDILPNLRSNAGLGWRVSLGRLLEPSESTTDHNERPNSSIERFDYVYEGPAGDEHVFDGGSHPETVEVQRTKHDGAALRLIKLSAAVREVEFPNGEVHRFEQPTLAEEEAAEEDEIILPAWRLKQIRDRTGNHIDISYSHPDGIETWTISDSAGRNHTVVFEMKEAMASGWSRGQQVNEVKLQSFGDAIAIYDFQYTEAGNALGLATTAPDRSVPLLTAIAQPLQQPYTFEYHVTDLAAHGSWGPLKKVTLPTRGSISYTYDAYQMADQNDVCLNAPFGSYAPLSTPGVSTRTYSDTGGSRVWQYVQRRGPEVTIPGQTSNPCATADVPNPAVYGPFYWSRTSVIAPIGSDGKHVRSDHFFNLWDGPSLFTAGSAQDSWALGSTQPFGYPVTAGVPPAATAKGSPHVVPEDPQTGYSADVSATDGSRYVSRYVYGGCEANGDCTNGTLLRTEYQKFEALEFGWHAQSSRTEFNDDHGCGGVCATEVALTEHNGAGQYRTVTTASNFPDGASSCSGACQPRTVAVMRTVYPEWTAAGLSCASKLWNLNTFTEKSRTADGATARTLYKFHQDTPTIGDAETGLLLGQRTLAGAALAPHDLLVVFGYDTLGNLTQERYFGGDFVSPNETGLSTSNCCDAPSSGLDYLVKNTYAAGSALVKREYLDDCTDASQAACRSMLTSIDYTRDDATGLVTESRDAAGAPTLYAYDVLGRVKKITPPVGAETVIEYTSSPNSPATATSTTDAGVTAQNEVNKLRVKYEFDPFGRVEYRRELLPDGTESVTKTEYDALGRVRRVSEPGIGAPGSLWTTMYYDAFDRPVRVIAPDATETRAYFTGMRRVDRKTKMPDPAPYEDVSSEIYDSEGRLRSVTEGAGPNGQAVVAEYAYDVGNRLASVVMRGVEVANGGTVAQSRSFRYDGRGFLLEETHPESNRTVYSGYDARGHAHKLQRGTPVDPRSDLTFTYDAAERLRSVNAVPTFSPMTLYPFKEFVYAEQNTGSGAATNYVRGRLSEAIRYNYDPYTGTAENPTGHGEEGVTYRVKERYSYGLLGKPVARQTEIARGEISSSPPAWSVVRTVNYSVDYDALGAVEEVVYPWCTGCSPTTVNLATERVGTRLQRMTTTLYIANSTQYASSFPLVEAVEYGANGLVKEIDRGNDMVDVITSDIMSRPKRIEFGLWDECEPANIVSMQPSALSGATYVSGAPPVNLSVTVTGTNRFENQNDFKYQWYANDEALTDQYADDPVYPAQPSQTTRYHVAITNDCRGVVSDYVTVTVNQCDPLSWSTEPEDQVVPRGETATFFMSVHGSGPISIAWYAGTSASGTVLGTGTSFTTGAVNAPASYTVKVTTGCNSASLQKTVVVEPALDSTAAVSLLSPLVATRSGNNAITLTWGPISGAHHYEVERRSGGGAFQKIAETTNTSYVDAAGLTLDTTYVYRVRATLANATDGTSSEYTNHDLATLMTFTAITPLLEVDDSHQAQLLAALNALRAAAGMPATSWAQLLSAGETPPQQQALISANHVMAMRRAMDQALLVLGVATGPYVDNPVKGGETYVSAMHLTQLQEKAQ